MAFAASSGSLPLRLQAALDGWMIVLCCWQRLSEKLPRSERYEQASSQPRLLMCGGRDRLPSFVIVMTFQHPILQ